MSERAKEFSLIASAEQHLCEAAESVFLPIIRAVKAQTGLCVTEVRVTFDPTVDPGAVFANCTIVGAHVPEPAAHHNTRDTVGSMRLPGAVLPVSQE